MTVKVIYAYPWDVVGDPSAPERLARLGADTVALAASYHSVRAATPFHPAHRLVEARPALYVPVRAGSWGRLVPAAPTWTAPDAFVQAADALRAAGLAVHAWTVLTHNSHLGTAHPSLAVRNAFGDRYPYALCPSHPDVVDYCRILVREIAELGAPDGFVLEACGPLGVRHAGTHEKTDGADWTAAQLDLLSLCFCTVCARRYPAGTRERVRTGVDTASPSVEAALGDLAPVVQELRAGLGRELQHTLRLEAAGLPVTLHANPHPWAAGAFSQVSAAPSADVLVANCWDDPASGTARLRRLRALAAPGTRLGASVLALPPATLNPETLAAYHSAGAGEIHVYHAGLASRSRLATITDTLRSFGSGAGQNACSNIANTANTANPGAP
ncbi:hypothetical protein [Streptosporangium sp. NBC_01469]|uniref:hypothetical protein n=1 Tax=Streptosporangium sp. NBC_01469 TaxID=2903898 RepID=UPI002E27C209|nr:hypothetical protein [Streptosporangium sp. NBC_01469]